MNTPNKSKNIEKSPDKKQIESSQGRSSSPPASRRQADVQLRYLSQAAFLEEAGCPRFAAYTVIIASVFVAGFIAWASFAKVNEVARTKGKVIPSGFEQVVQHLDGGIVRTINVKQGDQVEKGQLLLTIDDGTTLEELQRTKAKNAFLQTSEERLRAILEKRPPDFGNVSDATNDDIESQKLLYETTLVEQKTRERILTEQVAQKKQELNILQGRVDSIKKRLASVRDVYNARKKLLDKGLVSVPVFANSEQELFTLEGQLTDFKDQINQTHVAISEYKARLRNVFDSARLEHSQKLNETVTERRQTGSAIKLLQRRLDRLELRSPVRGLVKDSQVKTIGSVLGKGETVLSIVPLDDELVIETKIHPRDIGSVRSGQRVNVKVSAFDFSRFGVVPGWLQRISASSFTDDSGKQFYTARIKLDRTYVGENPEHNAILPGMGVMADIITGDKTIMDYLLKPIRIAVSTAFSER